MSCNFLGMRYMLAMALLFAACTDEDGEAPAPDAYVSLVPPGTTAESACMDLLAASQQMAERCGGAAPAWTCDDILGFGSFAVVYDSCIPTLADACVNVEKLPACPFVYCVDTQQVCTPL